MSESRIGLDGRRFPVRVFVFCVVAELLLVLLDAVVNYGKYSDYSQLRRLFNITREDGLATWFMVVLTYSAALVLWLTFMLQRGRDVTRARLMGWGFLAGFFTYMSADDGALIHERMGSIFNIAYQTSKSRPPEGLLEQLQALFPSYGWHLAMLPLLAGAGLFMLFFLWHEFHLRRERVLLITATASMAFAIGLDFIEGLDESHWLNVYTWLRGALDVSEYTVSHFAKSLEEFLEMLSISILLLLFLQHLVRISEGVLTIDFSGSRR